VAPTRPAALPEPPRGEIAFADVRFSYPTQPESLVLDGVSFRVRPGEKVAIVGPSGAGKSTIFHLMLRFYDPASGVITFDGMPLVDVDPLHCAGASRWCRKTPRSLPPRSAKTSASVARVQAMPTSSVRPSLRTPLNSSRGYRKSLTPRWASTG
jgi:ABC-type transport system involved in cytochrome bd biosynthesis fused ATPase/permease subunit